MSNGIILPDMSRGTILQEIANKTCRDVKPGYVISLRMENGAAWVELIGPSGHEITLPDAADKTIEQQINDAIEASYSF